MGLLDLRQQQLQKRKSLTRLIKKSRRLIKRENSPTTDFMRSLRTYSTERVKRVKNGTRIIDVIIDQKQRQTARTIAKKNLHMPKNKVSNFKVKAIGSQKHLGQKTMNYMATHRACPTRCTFVEQILRVRKEKQKKKQEENHIWLNLGRNLNYANPIGECKRRSFTDPVMVNLMSQFNGKLPIVSHPSKDNK